MTWFIAIFFGLSVGGFAWVLARSIASGADAYAGVYTENITRQFEDIFLFIPQKRIVELGWASAALAFLIVFAFAGGVTSGQGILVGAALGTIAGAFALRLPNQTLALLRRRRLKRFNLQLGDALTSMSNALRAGFSITQSFESVVRDGENPIAQEFDLFLQQIRVGVPFSDALQNLSRRVGSEDLTLVATAIDTARRTGGNVTEVFDQIAATIRERLRIEGRIMTLTAQGRLQGIIVSLMPVIIAFAMTVLDPLMMRSFLHSLIGLGTIVCVAMLIACGALMIRKIIRIDI